VTTRATLFSCKSLRPEVRTHGIVILGAGRGGLCTGGWGTGVKPHRTLTYSLLVITQKERERGLRKKELAMSRLLLSTLGILYGRGMDSNASTRAYGTTPLKGELRNRKVHDLAERLRLADQKT